MHHQECYELCCRYRERVVRIQDKDGKHHLGRVMDITENSVWIEPVGQRRYRGFNGGFGYGFGSRRYDDEFYGEDRYGYDNYGYDYYYAGAAYELAFGFIAGIALAALFFF
jgi:hypothetical protein